ncbi:D-serine dehydratase [Madurella mycetomatis]|uniref:D-serine dehydratase n=1 Tax=Madurella mycetomatis TaxID=100816 RepID=A0A175VU82_9PEZI|nr:D-serine dehydratase [Madurella mycetomatis]
MATSPASGELKEQLRARFVSKTLNEIPTPSAVLDLAKLQVNCERMLDATKRLGLLWRAHIKTHKTTELTRLQVGDDRTTPVSLIVSTINEAENILPLLREYQSKGRRVNVLFSFPLFPSAVPRLAALASHLGPQSLSLMVDHPSQLPCVAAIASSPASHPPLIFVKIDAGYGRAGVVPSSPEGEALIDAVLAEEAKGNCVFHGIYAHAGHSYGTREDWVAMEYLVGEFTGLAEVARLVRQKSPNHPLVLSVGATPTTTTIQYPGLTASPAGVAWGGVVTELETLIVALKGQGFELEVHAGVYATLDMQQLATHARNSSLMTADDIAISVVAEAASIYPGRGANGTTEALINAGTLALGREPVADKGEVQGKDYSGWGFLMPWGLSNPAPGQDFPRVHDGWQVGRISQEHGILTWQGRKEDEVPLQFGQRVRVWPNHSCIAGACFDWYLIVDSRIKGKEDEVLDVWPRCRGW